MVMRQHSLNVHSVPKSLKASSQEKRSKVFILGTIITWEDEFLRMMPGCWDGELDTWAKHKCDNSSPNYHSTVISSPETPRPTEPLDSIIQGWGVVKGGLRWCHSPLFTACFYAIGPRLLGGSAFKISFCFKVSSLATEPLLQKQPAICSRNLPWAPSCPEGLGQEWGSQEAGVSTVWDVGVGKWKQLG